MSKGITDRLFECSEQLELLHDVFEYGEADQDLTIGGGARKALSRTIGGIYSDILGVIGEISYPEEAVAEKQPTV